MFEQPEKLTFEEKDKTSNATGFEGNVGFSTRKFVANYQLGDLIAGNFFKVYLETPSEGEAPPEASTVCSETNQGKEAVIQKAKEVHRQNDI